MSCATCVLLEAVSLIGERRALLAALVLGIRIGRSEAARIELCSDCAAAWDTYQQAIDMPPGMVPDRPPAPRSE